MCYDIAGHRGCMPLSTHPHLMTESWKLVKTEERSQVFLFFGATFQMLMEHALSGDDCVGPGIENPHGHRIPMYVSALQQNHQYRDPRCASLLL